MVENQCKAGKQVKNKWSLILWFMFIKENTLII